MANFVALTDSDEARRTACAGRIRAAIAPVDGLRIDEIAAGSFAAIWAANERAPISVMRTESDVAVVWGDILVDGRPAAAGELHHEWIRTLSGSAAGLFDGYHAAVAWSAGLGWVAGTDLLGMFPLYHASRDGVCMVASSPELFRCHPSFPVAMDEDGLIDALLFAWPVRGRSLLSPVRRLESGAILAQPAGGEPVERAYYSLPVDQALADEPFEEHCRLVDEALEAVIAPGVASGTTGILLSGGTDSRLLAGYLGRTGARVSALTLGARTDNDARCARRVARRLGFAHALHDIGPETYPASTSLHARWEHLQTGFSTTHVWAAIPHLRELPPRFLTGYVLDGFIAGGPPTGRIIRSDELLERLNAFGVDSKRLPSLLRIPSAADRVHHAVEALRERFEAMPGPLQMRALRFQSTNSQRCTIGSVPWRLSHASWPVLPFLARGVLELVAAIPATSRADRRLQIELIRTRFPRIARLPIARNSEDTSPIVPTVASRISGRWHQLRRRAGRRGWLPPPVESRYFYRMYDFNGAGWRAARKLAEPSRDCLADLFDMDELNRFLPAPDVTIPFENPLVHSGGRKLLVGLMLWASEHRI